MIPSRVSDILMVEHKGMFEELKTTEGVIALCRDLEAQALPISCC